MTVNFSHSHYNNPIVLLFTGGLPTYLSETQIEASFRSYKVVIILHTKTTTSLIKPGRSWLYASRLLHAFVFSIVSNELLNIKSFTMSGYDTAGKHASYLLYAEWGKEYGSTLSTIQI